MRNAFRWQKNASDRYLETYIAVKRLHRFEGSSRRKFKNEFRTLQEISHRNIICLASRWDRPVRSYFSVSVHAPFQSGPGGCSLKWARRSRNTWDGGSSGRMARHAVKAVAASAQAWRR